MSNRNNDPAYPNNGMLRGLTKLEIFTMAAMQGLCARGGEHIDEYWIAEEAVEIAEKTLEELSKEKRSEK